MSIGKQLAEMREKVTKNCPECGQEFETYKHGKYCPKCRKKAWNRDYRAKQKIKLGVVS